MVNSSEDARNCSVLYICKNFVELTHLNKRKQIEACNESLKKLAGKTHSSEYSKISEIRF